MSSHSIPRGRVDQIWLSSLCNERPASRFEHVLVWECALRPGSDGQGDSPHQRGQARQPHRESAIWSHGWNTKRIHSGCLHVGDEWLKRCRRCQWMRSIDTDYYVYAGRNGAMGICRPVCL